MSILTPALTAMGGPFQAPKYSEDEISMHSSKMEERALGESLANLMTFPYVESSVRRGQLQLHAALFGVAHGSLSVRDPLSGTFAPCVCPCA